MYELVIEKCTLEYTGCIQGVPKGMPWKIVHKKHPDTQQDPTHSTKSNKGIEPSLKYTLTQEERLQRNESFNNWS